jgi:hypothetical protein
MEDDATLDTAASEQEQPVAEAVAPETQEAVAAPETETTEASTEQPSFETRAWAGKYQSPEELERAYLESQREASRMAGELSAMRKTPTVQATAAEPKWKQLEAERNKWAQYYRNPNLSEAERLQADEQVRLHDREIAYERARHEFETVSTKRTAEQQLETESVQVLQHYQTDLQNMSSPLYQAASSRFDALVRAGYPDNNTTKALAVAYAAAQTGRDAKAAVQQDRGKLLKSLNTNLKKAVVSGAGGPAAVKSGAVTAKDIDNMSPAEFAAYERKLLGV